MTEDQLFPEDAEAPGMEKTDRKKWQRKRFDVATEAADYAKDIFIEFTIRQTAEGTYRITRGEPW